MNRNILWLFLVTAPLISAGSLDSFEATCENGGCAGGGFSFSFEGPFPGFSDPFEPGADHQ